MAVRDGAGGASGEIDTAIAGELETVVDTCEGTQILRVPAATRNHSAKTSKAAAHPRTKARKQMGDGRRMTESITEKGE